eukprot:GHVS01022687.1.p1 GENE.GHVS01022687.1~~GHVS01022687.1.p1  ORF type:complete len:407 (-),score=97.19 GHVS01022687.1:430-1623(-)
MSQVPPSIPPFFPPLAADSTDKHAWVEALRNAQGQSLLGDYAGALEVLEKVLAAGEGGEGGHSRTEGQDDGFAEDEGKGILWWKRMCEVVMLGLKIQLEKTQDALTQCMQLCEEGGDLMDIVFFRRGQCEYLLNDILSAKASFLSCQAKTQMSSSPPPPPTSSSSSSSTYSLPLDQWLAACSTEAVVTTTTQAPPKKIRHEWTQNVGSVSLTIYCKNLQSTEHCQVEFTPPYSLAVHLNQPDVASTTIGPFKMGGEVMGDKAKVLLSAMKVEIVMPKAADGLWQNIAGLAQDASAASTPATTYPTSSKTKTDWNTVDKECSKEAEKDIREAGGDAALNEMFRDIYSKGTDETRRAMIKSFQTSCGTVLSTNWDEVKQKKYEDDLTAPSGQTVKKWEP